MVCEEYNIMFIIYFEFLCVLLILRLVFCKAQCTLPCNLLVRYHTLEITATIIMLIEMVAHAHI